MGLRQQWEDHKLMFGVYMVGFLDLLAVAIIVPHMPKHLESLGASQTLIGFHGSLYGFLQLLSSPVVGKLSDFYGRRRLLLTVLFLCSFSYFLFSLTDNLWVFFLFRIPSGLLKHSLSLGRACVADVSSEKDRSGRLGLYNAISSMGFVIGPALGGNLMATAGGFKFAVTITSVVFFLNFLLSWWLVHPDEHMTDGHHHTSADDSFSLRDSLTFLRSETWSRVSSVMLQRFVLSVSQIMLRSNFTLFLEHKFNAGPQLRGYIMSFSGVVSFVSSLTTGRITRLYSDESKLMFQGVLLMVISQVVLNFAPHISIFILFLIPLSFGSSVLRVITVQMCLRRVSPKEKGEVMGMGQSTLALARLVGPQLAGLAMEHSTDLPGTLGIGFGAVAAGLVYKHTLNRVERMKTD